MRVYHASYEEIRVPDIHRGRTNADFGQGFYEKIAVSMNIARRND